MGCDLPRHSTVPVIESNIEFDRLARTQWRLALDNLVWHQKQIVPVYEKVAIESCRIQKAPALSTASHVATMSLAQAFVWRPPHHGLNHHRLGTGLIIGLHIELNGLPLHEGMVLELRHDTIRAERNFIWEHMANHGPPGSVHVVRFNPSRQPLIFEIQSLFRRTFLGTSFGLLMLHGSSATTNA
jgi:hypothetical protein